MGVVRTAPSRWLVATLLLGSVLILGFAPSNEDAGAAPLPPEPAAPVALPGLRDDVLSLTNADRAAEGRDSLTIADRVSRYAVRHSRRMATLGSIFHSGDEQLREALGDADWSVAGENVGVGSSIRDVQAAFMRSAPHRRNILDGSYDHAAVGVVKADGVYWVTVILYGD